MQIMSSTFRATWAVILAFTVLSAAVILTLTATGASPTPASLIFNSPFDVAYAPNGKLLAVSNRTAQAVAIIDAASNKVLCQAALAGKPGGIAWSADSSRLYAAEFEKSTVAEVNAADGKVLRRFSVGAYPIGLAIAAKKQILLVGNTALNDLSIIDLASGKEKSRIPCLRNPFWISITPDESLAVVSNLLPDGAASEPQATASVSLIDLQTLKRVSDIKLPPNTTSIRQTAISPDGKWAYAVHTIGRTMLPATQLERGWVNTNALSIINLQSKQLFASVLLDNLTEGAADPWGIAISKDASVMWITFAGTHQLARIDLAGLHKCLAGEGPASVLTNSKFTTTPSIWGEIKNDPKKRDDLVNDLTALYMGGLIDRIALQGKGPRGLSLSPDGKQLAIGMYFTGQVAMIDTATAKPGPAISLGSQPEPDVTRRGEMIFHDANYAFQHWLSCATCHPNEGRVDGLNWDLPNDGIGNPKNAKSLLYAHKTPPVMWLGIRDSMETAAMAGFRFAANLPNDADLVAVQAYLRSLIALPSPYRLPNGDLSEKANRGQKIFQSEATGCAHCHSGDYYTNLKAVNVGTQGTLDHPDQNAFVTPPLIELWQTAPFLHDGRAATMRDVFTKCNAKDQHGKTSQLSTQEMDDLVEFLLSL